MAAPALAPGTAPGTASRLAEQWRRLFAADAAPSTAPSAGLVDAQGRVRALVLTLSHPADWSLIGRVWRGVQADLGLPAPAIAVNGVDGFSLWFSLAEPCAPSLADAWLGALCERYLADVEPHRLRRWPSSSSASSSASPDGDPAPVPRLQGASGNWSAFVAPDLAPVFGDTPWLDIPPGEDAQASLLAPLTSAPLADVQRALARAPCASPASSARSASSVAALAEPPPARPVHSDPRRFLLEVMNDEGTEMALRIEAARALLAHPA